jgi:curved DNA-binding protein CbpA
MYDPARLEGAADELINMARQKRDDIERAYAVLSDPVRRETYDAEIAVRAPQVAVEDAEPVVGKAQRRVKASDVVLDYRPLPPAGRTERSREFNAQPLRPTERRERGRSAGSSADRRWLAPVAIVSLLVVAIVGISVSIAGFGGPSVLPPPVPTASPLDQFEADIATARTFAEQNLQNVDAQIQYANLLYNSVEIVREFQPDSPLYQQRLPRWLEATQVYSRALELQPENAGVRGDLGAGLCFYGAGTGDLSYVRSGTVESRRAATEAPDDARVQLSLAQCLLAAQPAQTQEAIPLLRRVLELAPPESGLATQAQQLLARYENQ